MTQLCKSCTYWMPRDGSSGECRYHAPRPRACRDEEHYVDWPVTLDDEWCGRWKVSASARDERFMAECQQEVVR